MQNTILNKKINIMDTDAIDFTELQEEVMQYWETQGVEYMYWDRQSNDPIHDECIVKPQYNSVLDDPMACVRELGYNSLSEYVASKQKSETIVIKPIELGYARISEYSTKFFYQKHGRDLEFYIDRDPNTGIAKMWLNLGNTDGIDFFLAELAEAKK